MYARRIGKYVTNEADDAVRRNDGHIFFNTLIVADADDHRIRPCSVIPRNDRARKELQIFMCGTEIQESAQTRIFRRYFIIIDNPFTQIRIFVFQVFPFNTVFKTDFNDTVNVGYVLQYPCHTFFRRCNHSLYRPGHIRNGIMLPPSPADDGNDKKEDKRADDAFLTEGKHC